MTKYFIVKSLFFCSAITDINVVGVAELTPIHILNMHHMVTQSKNIIFKPMVLVTDLSI